VVPDGGVVDDDGGDPQVLDDVAADPGHLQGRVLYNIQVMDDIFHTEIANGISLGLQNHKTWT
jgi:hypothetical protein